MSGAASESGSSASVLAELDWDDGFAIPVANAGNQALEDELQKMWKEKANLQNQLTDLEERREAMTSHLKNVRQEFNFTQSLYRARENEIETEKHFKALAERELGRLKSEIQRLENEMISLREKKNNQENNIFKTTQKLEALRCQMNWDHQALEAWLEESARKDNDAVTIQKYAQQDDGKLRVLTLQIEKLTMETNQKRKNLDNELTETLTAQIELDKIAEDFRRVHHERQELIRQWESTIEQMQKRDQEIDHFALLLAETRQDIRKKEDAIKEKIRFLANETGNNIEYEKKIAATDRQAAKLRIEYQNQDANRVQLQDELDTLKTTVDRTASDLESMRTRVTNLKKEIQEKNIRLSLVKDQNMNLSNKLKFVTEKTLSLEEKAFRMEEILKEEERNVKEKETQMSQLKELHFKKTQELQVQQEKEKCLIAEIEGSQASLKNLNSRLRKLDADALKQQEITYNQDFYIQQVERRLSRLKGEVNTDERQVLEAKVAELKKTLEEKKNAYNVLHVQHKKVQSDIHFMKRAMDKTGEEMSGVMARIDELNLFNDKSDKEFKKAKAVKQDLMVEDNLLKLELKRLRDTLYNKAEQVLSLEKRKLQLNAAMAERTEEIKVHKAMLESQLRFVDQERQHVSAEFQERLSKIDKLRRRYEILTIVMMPPEGEEEKTQTYYVIKAAQDKEDLQREGDDLDAKIRKAEKEVVALENTLRVLNNCNSNYRNSFKKVTETSEEYEEKLQLEEEKRAADEKLRYKRRRIKELQEDVQSMENTLAIMLKQEAAYQEEREEKQAYVLQLNKVTNEQKPKLERIMKQCSRLSREVRSSKKTKTETQEEKDIDLRELKDFNRTIDKLLVDVLEANPDLITPFEAYFQQSGLELPTAASSGSSHSSRSSSSQSSAASVRSSRSNKGSASGQVLPKVVDLSLSISPPASATGASSRPSSAASSSSNLSSRKNLK
ncbi:coiled-coil domain-containing protein 39 [Alligator mississippiensis]|uniref:Coiled-coil domain-containing protein 39 n=1 Tax=Alligator mississippiensis TaxID=8496 RepID=A0A151M6A4_ALLMI|nr:coiled-coil domain-containing protein 39 [Alligator mississippiensis]KYO20049.1 coiled-coil domain-containing protein 39 [Alligator mississippiensis]